MMKFRKWLIRKLAGKELSVFLNGYLHGAIILKDDHLCNNVNMQQVAIEDRLLKEANKLLNRVG